MTSHNLLLKILLTGVTATRQWGITRLTPDVTRTNCCRATRESLTRVPKAMYLVFSLAMVVVFSILPCSGRASTKTLPSWDCSHPLIPTDRTEPMVVVAKDATGTKELIYVLGGVKGSTATDEVEAYDPDMHVWYSRASIPAGRAMVCGAIATGSNGKIYLFGGEIVNQASADVQEYDPANDTWTTKTPSGFAARFRAAAAPGKDGSGNNLIFVFGGETYWSQLSIVQAYNPIFNTWQTKTPKPGQAGQMEATRACNGLIYVFDASDGGVWEYNPANDTWSQKASMPIARCDFGVTTGPDGLIYLMGGHSPASSVCDTDVLDIYDPYLNIWNSAGSTPPNCTKRNRVGSVTLGSYVYSVGHGGTHGGCGTPPPVGTVESFGPLPSVPACDPNAHPDAWIQDKAPCDDGTEPDPCQQPGTPMWESDDIRVSHFQLPIGGFPLYNVDPIFPGTNYIYVKIHSRGNVSVSGDIKLYFAKSSTGLLWPTSWVNNPPDGDLIGTQPVNLGPRPAESVAEFTWNPPAPGHICLLARFDSPSDPMTFTEGTDIWANTCNNNNIAWKNLTVVDSWLPNEGEYFLVRNVKNFATNVSLEFNSAGGDSGIPFLDRGSIRVVLAPQMLHKWMGAGGLGQGIIVNPSDSSISLTSLLSKIQGIPMDANEIQPVTIYFTPDNGNPPPAFQHFLVSQFSNGQTIPDGGITFEFRFGTGTVPTLSEWGLIIFGVVLLGFISWVFLRKRKTALSLR
jgi:N-acetylneuraminic acid mutarotase